MIDIVFPRGNEQKFVEMAERLRYSSLCFVYENERNVPNLENSKVRIFKAFAYGKDKKGFLLARSSEKDRHLIESRSVGLIYDFELLQRSQLNHILAQLCHDKGVFVGFSFNSIINSGQRDKLIGKMAKHIELCRKYKVKMVLGSFASDPYGMRSPHDLAAFAVSIGMHPSEAKQSLLNLKERLERP